ncbi:TlpA family protein disulfide reductase [Agromyces mangrovi Wang et al. 2018]|uniref:TlpA family protein disulfide reductase n=1 Tax=Agromyces mangrovi TaxID=1858653 RepID=UPI0025746FD3|nr:TlpA disulfide reductase family protein [Agromyces mangrovi]BDZ65014.1 thiol-disulfide isomerase [Agromyces mangrovi]
MRRLAAVALAAASVVVLAGCGSDPLADQYRDGSGKNYIAGDGTITEIAPADRGEPIAFAGESIEGEPVSSDDYAGEVLIVNFWYAGCAPCRAEAPDLQAVSEEFAGRGAGVLGVNVRDQAPTAASFEADYGITYPSIVDTNDGSVQLAFAGDVPPNAVPTTLVLDAEGRVAARILGQLNRSNLQTIVGDVLDEGA